MVRLPKILRFIRILSVKFYIFALKYKMCKQSTQVNLFQNDHQIKWKLYYLDLSRKLTKNANKIFKLCLFMRKNYHNEKVKKLKTLVYFFKTSK